MNGRIKEVSERNFERVVPPSSQEAGEQRNIWSSQLY
jgi:hypothetical protein